MRRKGLWLSALATALIAGNVSAAPIAVNGFWDDWFASDTIATGSSTLTNGDLLEMQDWQQFATPSHNYEINPFTGIGTYKDPDVADGANGQNGPGVGGQPYDAEQIFYTAQDNVLYIGLITGFNPGGEGPSGVPAPGINVPPTVVPNRFIAGDLFLSFGPINNPFSYDLAIGLSTHASANRSGNVWAGQFSLANSNTEDVYYTQAPNNHTSANPFLVSDSVTTTNLVTASVRYNDYSTGGISRWFYEIAITGINPDALSAGLGYHWTMECGNDYIRNYDDLFTPTLSSLPVVPVPAAAPLGLLGMGLLALVRRVRRRPEC